MTDPQVKVIAQVIQERKNQDRQWGGPDHDDSHNLGDWMSYFEYQFTSMGEDNARQRLIKIAALAVAAVESIDRKESKNEA